MQTIDMKYVKQFNDILWVYLLSDKKNSMYSTMVALCLKLGVV